jgi:hypothetical protein
MHTTTKLERPKVKTKVQDPPKPPTENNKKGDGEENHGQNKTRLNILYTNGARETYEKASIIRKTNNTLWITFYGKIVKLENVLKHHSPTTCT